MPQLKFKGITINEVCKISENLVNCLSEIIDCPRDYFILECVNSQFVFDGKITSCYPIVEVFWFDRGQDVQDKSAEEITKQILELGKSECEVVFYPLSEKNYYENGKHY